MTLAQSLSIIPRGNRYVKMQASKPKTERCVLTLGVLYLIIGGEPTMQVPKIARWQMTRGEADQI